MKINTLTIYRVIVSVLVIAAFFAIGTMSFAQNINVRNENTNTLTNNNNTSSGSNCGSNNYCNYPPLSGSCVVSVSRGEIGDTITWQGRGTGGNGYFSYRWTGTDGLASEYPTVYKRYTTAGTKTGTVQITSNYQTITRTCTVIIEDNQEENDNLGGYCTGRPSNPDVDERVTWTAYPEGGDGDYDYDWSGTDNLDGDDKSITKSYDDEGTKSATVRITSDGKTITRTCNVRVKEDNDRNNDKLKAYCKASPNDANIGDRIKWTVYPDGGDNDYEYKWDGDENLSGDDKSITKTYRTSGRKEAEVRVESDGDRVTVRCYADIEKDTVVYNPPAPAGGIYLSSIPATGISPTLKVSLFVAGLFMWSAFLSYLYIARRNEKMKEAALLASIEK